MTNLCLATRPADISAAARSGDVTAIRGDHLMANTQEEVFLSTAATRQRDRRLAVAVVLVSVMGLALALPFANDRWPVTPSFIAAYEAAMIVSDLITAVLLIGQFRHVRSVGV